MAEQITGLLRALVGEVRDALLAIGLCTHDLIGVLDPPSGNSQRQLVRQKSRVQREIDSKRQAFRGSEHQLGASTGELGLLGQGPHDELDLPPGRLQVKIGGGTAGHNGLRSVQSHLHSAEFLRVRIGVGKPPSPAAGADHPAAGEALTRGSATAYARANATAGRQCLF